MSIDPAAAAAEAALDAMLADSPTISEARPVPEASGDAAAYDLPRIEPVQTGTVTDDTAGPCTRAEARTLVDAAINAATTLVQSLAEIFRRQAWVPLGYATAADMWAAELGSRVSPSYRSRLLRVLGVYELLHERIGDDAFVAELTERSIRTLRESGGDMAIAQFVDGVETGVRELGPNRDPDQVKAVVQSVMENVRHTTKDRDADPAPPLTEEDLAAKMGQFQLDDMPPMRPDLAQRDNDTDDDEQWVPERATVAARSNRDSGYSASTRTGGGDRDEVGGTGAGTGTGPELPQRPVDPDITHATMQIATLTNGMRALSTVTDMPAILERISGHDLDILVDQLPTIRALCDQIESFADSDDAPVSDNY